MKIVQLIKLKKFKKGQIFMKNIKKKMTLTTSNNN